MSIHARSVVFSTHTSALVCNSLSSLYHSIVGSGLPEMPALNFTEVPALYLTTSVYSRGKSITGPPARNEDEWYLEYYKDEKNHCCNNIQIRSLVLISHAHIHTHSNSNTVYLIFYTLIFYKSSFYLTCGRKIMNKLCTPRDFVPVAHGMSFKCLLEPIKVFCFSDEMEYGSEHIREYAVFALSPTIASLLFL